MVWDILESTFRYFGLNFWDLFFDVGEIDCYVLSLAIDEIQNLLLFNTTRSATTLFKFASDNFFNSRFNIVKGLLDDELVVLDDLSVVTLLNLLQSIHQINHALILILLFCLHGLKQQLVNRILIVLLSLEIFN